jgi:hypothetical protein
MTWIEWLFMALNNIKGDLYLRTKWTFRAHDKKVILTTKGRFGFILMTSPGYGFDRHIQNA